MQKADAAGTASGGRDPRGLTLTYTARFSVSRAAAAKPIETTTTTCEFSILRGESSSFLLPPLSTLPRTSTYVYLRLPSKEIRDESRGRTETSLFRLTAPRFQSRKFSVASRRIDGKPSRSTAFREISVFFVIEFLYTISLLASIREKYKR